MSEFPLDKQSYELLHLIASSPERELYVGRCILNGKLVGIKIINLEVDNCVDHVMKMTSFWSQFPHPNLIKYYGSFYEGTNLWILSEYMDGGSLKEIMQFAYQDGLKDEILAASILEQVLMFLAFFHENRQIHRDICSQNIFLSNDGDVKVGSLGDARSLVEGGKRRSNAIKSSNEIDSIAYSAPELLKEGAQYKVSTDIWSVGITAYEIATGKIPYEGLTPADMIMQISQGSIPELKQGNGISSKYTDFIKMCLQKNPDKRATARELLKSPFIKQSKGQKYIATTLMSSMPSIDQRYELLHKATKSEDVSKTAEPPAYTKIKFNFGFDQPAQSDSSPNQSPSKNQSGNEEDMPQEQNQKQQKEPEQQSVTHVGRFTVTIKSSADKPNIRRSSSAGVIPKSSSEEFFDSIPKQGIKRKITISTSKDDLSDLILFDEDLINEIDVLKTRVAKLENSSSSMQSKINETRNLIEALKVKKAAK